MIRCNFVASATCVVDGMAQVQQVPPQTLVLSFSEHANLTVFWIGNFGFSFSDPREAHLNIRANLESKFEHFLSIDLPSNQLLFLAEIKGQ
jgi:hypothetical protein